MFYITAIFVKPALASIRRRIGFCAALLVAVPLLYGCAGRQTYEADINDRLQECDLLEGSRREQCLALNQANYESYERDRRDLMEEKAEEAEE